MIKKLTIPINILVSFLYNLFYRNNDYYKRWRKAVNTMKIH